MGIGDNFKWTGVGEWKAKTAAEQRAAIGSVTRPLVSYVNGLVAAGFAGAVLTTVLFVILWATESGVFAHGTPGVVYPTDSQGRIVMCVDGETKHMKKNARSSMSDKDLADIVLKHRNASLGACE